MDIGSEPEESHAPLPCPVEGCGKTFTRADHVRRHVSSSHHRALPFQCNVCKKRFGRRDLLKRHALKHEERNADASSRSKEHKPRVRQACLTCATKKLKCDGEWPCSRCTLKSIECSYPHRESLSGGTNGLQSDGSVSSMVDQSTASDHYSHGHSDANGMGVPTPLVPVATQNGSHVLDHSLGTSASFQPQFQTTDAAYLGDILDFGHVYSLDFSEADISILESLDTDLPRPSRQSTSSISPTTQYRSSSNNMFLIGGFEAFSKSLWYWNPEQRRNRALDERESLRVPIENSGAGTTVRLGNERIDQLTRDRFLIIVADSFQLGNPSNHNNSFFPSEKILNDLLQFSLAEQYLAIDSWVHSHMFQSKEGRVPLLGSLVVHGAVQSALPTVQKFGYAFQEALRLKGPSVFEEHSRLTRDIGCVQAYVMIFQACLYSGVNRKIEIAEAFLGPTVTMLRRSGCFQADYVPIEVTPNLSGGDLYDRWEEFLKQETRKRLALHCMMQDAQTSIALQNNNLISVAEVSVLPLPAPVNIWQAESAEGWKAAMLTSRYNGGPTAPSVAQCIDDITHLVNELKSVDFPLSALAVLYGYWQFIRQHQEIAALHFSSESPAPSTTSHLLEQRQQQLATLLSRFKSYVIPLIEGPPRVHITLVHEAMTMYLHIRMSELQLFAGKHGEQGSIHAFSRLKAWIASPASRTGIRHAALVLRAAAQLRPGSLRDFLAIAVYHASLTLWSYGTISRAQRGAGAGGLLPDGPTVVLDHPADGALLHAFVAAGRGVPHVSVLEPDGAASREPPADLENPPGVMKACLRVLEGNFGKLAEGLQMPLLVENLAKLMRDLGEHAFVSVRI